MPFPAEFLDLLGLRPRRVVAVKDVPRGNGNWLVEETAGERLMLRRYADSASPG